MISARPEATTTQMLSWASSAEPRLETVRVVITDRGLRASGYIIAEGDRPYGASYQVLADVSGRTRRLTVQSDTADGQRHLALTRTPGGPWVVESTAGSQPLFALNGAEDLHLDASAFTPSLSLRRLSGAQRQRHVATPVRVGCISMPGLEVRGVDYEYTFGDGDAAYRNGPDGHTEITVDDSAFVVSLGASSKRVSGQHPV